MHFDDRLGTVLRLRASGPAVQRIQYRQLLDLLGTLPAEARSEQLDAAYVRLGELSETIPAPERAAVLDDNGLRLRAPRLVADLARGEPLVAQTTLQRASLTEAEWLDLVPALPPSARIHLRRRGDLGPSVSRLLERLGVNDRGLPPAAVPVDVEIQPAESVAGAEVASNLGDLPAATAEPAVTAEVAVLHPPQPTEPGSRIGAIVKRIEAYRRAKQIVEHTPVNDSPRLPLDEEAQVQAATKVAAFDFASDASGRIIWSDPGVAPMVSGSAISGTTAAADLLQLMRRHQPIRAQHIHLAGGEAIAGRWQIDATPWFDPLTGGFIGYRGRMRRPAERRPLVPPVTDSQSDRIRQMLHELRTPVNAIQGFAEVIQQQLFGPTPHDYRALAAGIAGDAARMLSAFEELERLAKLDSGALELESGETDLAAVIATTVDQLGAHTAPRGSGFVLRIKDEPLPVALDRLEVERIVWRLLASLAGVSAPGEILKATLRVAHHGTRLDVALPAALTARGELDLFETTAGAIPQTIAAGVFGLGFALRLARAEARAAGGDLVLKDDRLRLTLPGLTTDAADHTQAG